MTIRSRIAAGLMLAVAVAAGCGSPATERPKTPARLTIVSPKSGAQVAGAGVVVQLRLRGAEVVAGNRAGEALRPDQGHVHLSVDGRPTLMSYTLRAVLRGLTPGEHTVEAEFVATDHAPFSNRVVAAATFEVT